MIQVGTPQPATAPTTGSNPTISSMKIIASETTKPITLDFAGAPGLKLVKAMSLSAPRLEDRNPPDDPDRISPKDVTAAFSASPSLKPFSYTVLEFRK